MAANLVFKFITDDSALKKGVSKAKGELGSLEKTTKSVGAGMSKALGAVGISLGIGAIVSGLQQAGKAAVEDSKAQAILAQSMRNAVGANASQIASTEEFIGSLERKTSILDDQLRPAYATIIRSTKDLTQTQRLLTLATDVSAGSGKDLGMVSQAIAKAYNGQFASLNKLIPGISKAKDPIAELEKRFGGLAETAANADPFTRMQVIFNDMQEKLGAYLIPYLEQFANYLASPEGSAQLEQIVQFVGQLVTGFGQLVGWVAQNIQLIIQLAIVIGVIRTAWGLAQIAILLYNTTTVAGIVATTALKAAIASTGIGLLIVGLGTLAASMMSSGEETDKATDSMNTYTDAVTGATDAIENLPKSDFSGAMPLNPKPGEVYTWFNYSDPKNPNLATWWTQTWTGKTWTKAVPMTYSDKKSSGGSKPPSESPADRIKKMTDKVKEAGQKFRDALDLSSNLNDTGDVFNVQGALDKVRKVVEAAKKLPALLQQLRAKGASPAMLTDIFSMGPIGGVATASALLESGNLNEFIAAEKTLTTQGMKAGAIAGADAGTGNKTYAININKANMTAEEIIAAIQKYERKTGKKVVFG